MYSVAKILEMMAKAGAHLGEIDASVPRLAGCRREVNCSWEHKGKVMRNIMHDSEGRKRDLVDGVKIHFEDGGNAIAVLLIPDKERPLFHIYSQARDQATADRVAAEYEQKIIRWRDEP
jgi:mannose-1-phosphate guanylyltransferase / phosphomannomutase